MESVYSGSPKASESNGFGKGFEFRTKDNVYVELMQAADGLGVEFYPTNPTQTNIHAQIDRQTKGKEEGAHIIYIARANRIDV